MSWWSRVSSAWSSRCGAKGSATSLELWDAASILAQHRGLRIFFQSLSLISCLFISLLRTQDLPSSISWFMIYPLDSVLLKNVSFYTLVQHSPISLSLLTLKKLSLFPPPIMSFHFSTYPVLIYSNGVNHDHQLSLSCVADFLSMTQETQSPKWPNVTINPLDW